MQDLLLNEFIYHYKLQTPTISNWVINTNEPYFEVEDTDDRELVIHVIQGAGIAKFQNENNSSCSIINYDKFITSLPNEFQRNRSRCDLLMTSDKQNYFILGELKNSPEIKQYRKRAKKQLLSSLKTLLEVPEILAYSKNIAIKRCCYFNKLSSPPIILNAVYAFNRLPNFFPEGLQMPNDIINDLDFKFYEFTGNQVLNLTD